MTTRTAVIERLNNLTPRHSWEVTSTRIKDAADMLEADGISPEQHYMNGFSEGTKRTNKLIEAARQAKAALETCRIRSVSEWEVRDVTPTVVNEAITALKEALK